MQTQSAVDQEELVEVWLQAFKQASDFDVWGQPVEAIDIYQRLAKQLQHFSYTHAPDVFTHRQKQTLEKIAVCLDSRRQSLEKNEWHRDEGISLRDLKRLEKTLENLLGVPHGDTESSFPVDVTVASAHLQKLMVTSLEQDCIKDSDSLVNSGCGSILPKPLPVAGKTLLSVTVEHIGLKDTSQYLDAYISVSVRDVQGKALTCSQDTPVSSKKTDTIICFNCCVHIQKTLESLPPGFAVFFELRHYKPKKSSTSTKCWAFMEQDEIKEGPLALELYKKPVDVRRKSLKLFTTKPLYLHLSLKLHT